MINFKNKKILITGATGGIGGALVKKFISLHGEVLGTGTKIDKLDLLKKENPGMKIKKFDISDHGKIEDFVENVSNELGGLDILINNAGVNVDNFRSTISPEFPDRSIYLAKIDYRKRQHLFQSIGSLYFAGEILNLN